MPDDNWTITIERNGMWPCRWTWDVQYFDYVTMEFHSRHGDARTRDRAQHKAATARVSIEHDDLTIHD